MIHCLSPYQHQIHHTMHHIIYNMIYLLYVIYQNKSNIVTSDLKKISVFGVTWPKKRGSVGRLFFFLVGP